MNIQKWDKGKLKKKKNKTNKKQNSNWRHQIKSCHSTYTTPKELSRIRDGRHS